MPRLPKGLILHGMRRYSGTEEAELHIFGMRKRNLRSFEVLAEQKCGERNFISLAVKAERKYGSKALDL